MGSTQIALTGGSRLSQPPSPWPHRERGAPSPPLRSSCSESGLSARRARRLGAPGPTLPVMRLPGPSPPPWGWGVGGPGVSPTLSGSPPSPAHEAPSPRLLWGCQGGRVRLLLGELGGWGRPGRGRGGGAPPFACLPPPRCGQGAGLGQGRPPVGRIAARRGKRFRRLSSRGARGAAETLAVRFAARLFERQRESNFKLVKLFGSRRSDQSAEEGGGKAPPLSDRERDFCPQGEGGGAGGG